MLKLHWLLAKAVTENLTAIFHDGKYADKVISSSLKINSKWGSRDRKYVAETTYDIVRNYRLLYSIAGTKNVWPLLAAYMIKKEMVLPDWKEFSGLSVKRIKSSLDESKNNFSLYNSIPVWLDELGREELNQSWEQEIIALNHEAKVILRTNTLKIKTNDLRKQLDLAGIETELSPEIPEALILKKRQNIFSTQQFKNGFFEIQDLSSQRVAYFMQLKEGQKVIDACAGGGGKSLHISTLMKNKGKIISMDVRENKLEELKKRASRAGVFNIETKLISDENISRLKNSADRVLLDAPCSGLGVLRRNPDAKWKLSLNKIEEIKKVQSKILNEYSQMVKPGGKLIYVTCSILPSENNNQIKSFLSSNRNFEIEEEKTIFPSEGFDGFYMCRMYRAE